MIVRHVETLRDLGFDAVCYIGVGSQPPKWLDHRAPLELATPLRLDDIVVAPDDGADVLKVCAEYGLRTVVFCQGIYQFAVSGMAVVEQLFAERLPPFIAVGGRVRETLHRSFPEARVELVPCFADERVFRPRGTREHAVAYTPAKRPHESAVIRNLFGRFYPKQGDLKWRSLDLATERQMSLNFAASSLFLSLNCVESVGITTLEAMASGCVCAGFTGVGGDEYAKPENGFWVPNEYCEAAADALAQASDLVETGGPPLRQLVEAGHQAASEWSYARFRTALEETWMRLAPDARLRSGPLDTHAGIS